jgi:UDP-glucose 4-epimerase
MRILVTGSSGHLGDALVRALRAADHDVVGLDIQPSPSTDVVGSVADAEIVRQSMRDVDAVLATATLHKPHIVTHSRREFVDTNVTGTLNLLEAAAANRATFVYTSTTSVFGHAARPSAELPSAWVTEDLQPVPRNIYGVTKRAAEDLCELFHRKVGLACVVLRTSRFFPDQDDDPAVRGAYVDDNVKVNEFLYRRVELEDVVSAHLLALERAPSIGFGRYIVSATTPFSRDDVAELRTNAPAVVQRLFPDYETLYARRRWRMFPNLDRVYVNERARAELGWRPRYDFRYLLDRIAAGEEVRSPVARAIGFKGYHAGKPADEMYPVE